ncbi:hypothetical protein AB0H88_45835 [Nonomuraea sp. NPDC050680]|uniref:hypothetical protein n=1 Tax=Nonomuraea sp. NPDC050680 TaxID=3154630 RepID=UPI0034058A38
MSVLAFLMMKRADMVSLDGPKPDSKQVETFLAFIAGGLATVATVLAMFVTQRHNMREQRRLRMEAVLNSINSLPEGAVERESGLLPAMVMLGQAHIALRALEPAWEKGKIDVGGATWVLGQVLAGEHSYNSAYGNDPIDRTAIAEAAMLLEIHARKGNFTDDAGHVYFPGYLASCWNRSLPAKVKPHIFRAGVFALITRSRSWWFDRGSGNTIPLVPVEMLIHCVKHDRDRRMRATAICLLDVLQKCFSDHAGQPERSPTLGDHERSVGRASGVQQEEAQRKRASSELNKKKDELRRAEIREILNPWRKWWANRLGVIPECADLVVMIEQWNNGSEAYVPRALRAEPPSINAPAATMQDGVVQVVMENGDRVQFRMES